MARSLSGHDKGRYYVVIGEEGCDCILVDGSRRTMDKPKQKRLKHVRLIKHFPRIVREEAKGIRRWDDCSVKKIIKLYLKEEEHCQKQT